jgi:hypothetical protein
MSARETTFGSPEGVEQHNQQTDASENVRKTLDTTLQP